MAYFPPTGSVVSFQSDPTKLQVTASVAGTVNISGSVAALIVGNSSVITINQSSVAAVIQNNSLGSVFTALTTETGNLQVQPDSNQVFYDAWDTGTVDTTFNWQAAVLGGNATSTPSIGQEVIVSGNSASSFGVLSGKNNFQPVSPGFLNVDHQIKMTYPPATHTYAFWGVGSVVGVPTASVYAANAIGFEVATTGAMNAVTWASSTKNLIQNLASVTGTGAQPADGNTHRYELTIRGDTIYWLIDNKTVASILTGAQGPDSNLLPILILTGTDSTGTAGPSSVFTLNSQAIYMGDSTKAGQIITDKLHPQYAATVKPPATAVASVDGALVVGLHPSSPLPSGSNVIGSVAAYQGASPWNIAGSVAAFQAGTRITSLVSTIPSSVIVGSSIFGQLPAGTAPIGSVATLQGTNPWFVQPTSGSVISNQGGAWSTSVMTNVITSIATAGAVMGSVAALQATNPWIVNFQNSSIIAINAGSVVAVPVGSVITVNQGSSILAVPVGSVITVLQSPSIVGSYSVAATYAATQKAIATMGIRNDTMASIASADLGYTLQAIGPAGETVVANAPITKWVQGTISVLNQFGTSVVTIAAQGSSIFTYITGIQIANMSASSVLVTLSGATSSVVGYSIAPPGGGSNIVFPNALKTNANGAFTASVSGVCSVYLSAQGFISKT